MYSREVILEEIEQFRNDNPNDEEFYSTLADYIEQIQEEARPVYVERDKEKGQATGIALGIHIHKIMMSKFPKLVRVEDMAYEVAKELDFNYEFYYKRGK